MTHVHNEGHHLHSSDGNTLNPGSYVAGGSATGDVSADNVQSRQMLPQTRCENGDGGSRQYTLTRNTNIFKHIKIYKTNRQTNNNLRRSDSSWPAGGSSGSSYPVPNNTAGDVPVPEDGLKKSSTAVRRDKDLLFSFRISSEQVYLWSLVELLLTALSDKCRQILWYQRHWIHASQATSKQS